MRPESAAAAHMVFIPAPATGHLFSTVEIAKLLLSRDPRLSITVMLMKVPYDNPQVNSYSQTHTSLAPRGLSFVDLHLDDSAAARVLSIPRHRVLSEMIEFHKPRVRQVASDLMDGGQSSLAAVVVDMFCTPFLDVVQELGIPSYVFFTSGAGFLGLSLHIQSLHDDPGKEKVAFAELNDSLHVPCFRNPIPTKCLPSDVLNKNVGPTSILTVPRRFRETNGILMNTFLELEPYAFEILSSEDSKIPPIYPVGPLLNFGKGKDTDKNEMARGEKAQPGPSEAAIMNWLDSQTPASVVYLCFGSMGTFEKNQTREIALALERAKCPFLWSLRRAPQKESVEDPDDFLPGGFSERTANFGMVIGWAPQVAILSHRAVGGFVSHCGWNSTLESLWFGVPMATWPMYAEQQVNAFVLVRELGLAVEISIDTRKDWLMANDLMVTSDEIEMGIRRLMDPTESASIRKRVQEMKERCRGALQMGGSSYSAVGNFIADSVNNSSPK